MGIDGLKVVMYNYTRVINDTNGNSASNTVWITVVHYLSTESHPVSKSNPETSTEKKGKGGGNSPGFEMIPIFFLH